MRHSVQNVRANPMTRLDVTPTAAAQSRLRVASVSRLTASVSSATVGTEVTAIPTWGSNHTC